jgi:hypothetical protein
MASLLQSVLPLAEPNMDECAVADMSDKELYDEATKVSADKGEVVLDGPDGVDVRLTPEAALETSDNLLEAAATAAGQRRRENLSERPG